VLGPRDEGAKKTRPPSKEVLREILSRAEAEMRLKVMFAAFTGLRASEQWALKWRNLNLVSGVVFVEERVDAYGEEGGARRQLRDNGKFRWPVRWFKPFGNTECRAGSEVLTTMCSQTPRAVTSATTIL
jgi:integrase